MYEPESKTYEVIDTTRTPPTALTITETHYKRAEGMVEMSQCIQVSKKSEVKKSPKGSDRLEAILG